MAWKFNPFTGKLDYYEAGSAPGAVAWGDITGTLSGQTDLQTALNGKAATLHTHAIADVTGLQGALDGKAATLGADDNYVTDAEKTKLANLSGTNTGDQTSIVGITGTKAQFDTAVTDGNFLYVGDVTTNATHTGEVTGSGALTVDKTTITNKTLVTAAVGDHVLIADASDSDNLKRVTVQTIIDLAGGDSVSDAAYDASWNGDTTTAPSKNAVYDKIETLSAGSGLTAPQVASLTSIRF